MRDHHPQFEPQVGILERHLTDCPWSVSEGSNGIGQCQIRFSVADDDMAGVLYTDLRDAKKDGWVYVGEI